ncbi:enoyl-CoA hydratase/isomerase family protein [Candidatus Sumerlaeota bacterium]|nr:enoyl-CoA hydratase/isomerase family protein [Candidatus Sumerlaeota bacterium]
MEDSILTHREGPLGWLILNRPDKLNAFNLAMWQAVPSKLAELEANPEIRAIVIRGAGEKAFGAGADISEFEENRKDPQTAAAYASANDGAFRALRECSKPTIAMIHGFCVGGGCAVALCADIRLASADAKFALTPARLGLGYSFSGIEHAVKELGPAATRYLFLTAGQIAAAKALELGLVQEVHLAVELESKTRELALTISENAPLTLRAAKEAIRQAQLAPQERDSATVEELIAACFASQDYREGLRAFSERRRPKFQGR